MEKVRLNKDNGTGKEEKMRKGKKRKKNKDINTRSLYIVLMKTQKRPHEKSQIE